MAEQSFDRSLRLHRPHRTTSGRQRLDEGPLDHSVAEPLCAHRHNLCPEIFGTVRVDRLPKPSSQMCSVGLKALLPSACSASQSCGQGV